MDFLDYLSYEPTHKEFIDTMIMLFGLNEILTALCYGSIILEGNVIALNIQ